MKPKHLLPLLALAMLSACSITKREYMPGYDVQWHNKKEAVGSHPEPVEGYSGSQPQTFRQAQRDNTPELTATHYELNDTIVDQAFAKAEDATPQAPTIKEQLTNITNKTFDKAIIKQFKKELIGLIDEDESNQRLQNIGLWLAILGVVLIITSVIVALQFLFSPTPPIVGILLFVGAVALIAGLIVSAIALKKAKESIAYVKRGKAIAGIVISVVSLIPILLLLIALIASSF